MEVRGTLGVNSISQITDRLSMEFYFTQLYTTRTKRPSLKAVVFLSKISPESIETIVGRSNKLKNFNINVTRLEPNLYRCFLKRFISEEEKSGYFLLDTSMEETWIVFTNYNVYFVSHVLESFFDKLYPFVSRVYFNYLEMKTFLDKIKETYRGTTTYTKFAIRRSRKAVNLPSSIRYRKGTMILWERDADEELLKQSRDYLLTVTRLNFEIKDRSGMLLLRSSISRKGRCTLNYGAFRDFYNNVILATIEYGKNQKKFYNYRKRTIINKEVELSPFSIVYSNQLEIHSIKKLSVKLISSYSTSIIHGGNPYFVATLTDYDEGSSFGLTILGDTVTITPISKGAPEATWKLTDTIQEILGDGTIKDVGL